MYPPELTRPMRAELTGLGVQELTTADEVDAALQQAGTSLVFVNSVCGCAAGGARPGLAGALAESSVKPDRITTVFAGVDREAVERARSYLVGYPPSSPSAALLKDGDVVWMLHRHQIEGRHPQEIAEAFSEAFAEHCSTSKS
jgi:putative YphP/YqiW family bacilliredoxin